MRNFPILKSFKYFVHFHVKFFEEKKHNLIEFSINFQEFYIKHENFYFIFKIFIYIHFQTSKLTYHIQEENKPGSFDLINLVHINQENFIILGQCH